MPYVEFKGNSISSPVWAGDFFSREHIVPFPAKIDAAAFADSLGATIEVGANAAADATSVSVLALPVALKAGTVLTFGGKKFVTLTAHAAAGATTISVSALPTALVTGDTAKYSKHGRKLIPSGTLVGRTFTERDAGTGFGPAAHTDDEIYLLAFDVKDANENNDCELYRHESLVKENFLPDWSTISANANLLAAMRGKYTCIKGEA